MLIAGVRNKFSFPVRSVIKQKIKSTGEGSREVPKGNDRDTQADTEVNASADSLEPHTKKNFNCLHRPRATF